MKEKVKDFLNKAKEKLKKLTKKTIIIIVSVIVLISLLIVLALNHRPYSVLVTDVTQEEAGSITTLLEELGVTNYKVEGSDTILVPSKDAPRLKAKLLQEGYPKTGFSSSYDSYYEHVGSLSTESERKQSWLIAQTEDIEATLRCLENVKNASVQITPGEDRGYVLDSGNVTKASASVLIETKDKTKLSNDMANAIRNYVKHSVQGLEFDSVSITDTLGNTYNAGEDDSDGASALKLKLEEEWENKINTNVMKVLIPFFGEDNVKVSVNCEVEVSKVIEHRHDVYLPPWADDGSTNGKGIVGSERYQYYVERPGENAPGGLVGAETNSDIAEQVELEARPDGSEIGLGGDGQVDYNNPESKKEITRTAGELVDCSIAVSLNSAAIQNVNYDELRQHVARAAGIQGERDPNTGEEFLEDKISVVSLPFPKEPVIVPGGFHIPAWVLIAAGTGLLIFLLVLLLVLRIRKKRKQKLEEEEAREALLAAGGIQAAAALAADEVEKPQGGADIMSMKSERSMELRQDIRQFASDNPEITAQQLKSWLRGGDEDG